MTLVISAAADRAFGFVLSGAIEGGYSENPSDHGGPTNHGVTLGTLRGEGAQADLDHDGDVDRDDVKRISVELARSIYHRRYWLGGHCDELEDRSQNVAIAHFDADVQHSLESAAKLFQRACNATADGAIGPRTLEAYARRLATLGEHAFLEVLLEYRRGHYARILAADPSQQVFRNGWRARVNALCRFIGIPPTWE
jgi:lysozyme family protein